jgi:hypothetical protein
MDSLMTTPCYLTTSDTNNHIRRLVKSDLSQISYTIYRKPNANQFTQARTKATVPSSFLVFSTT